MKAIINGFRYDTDKADVIGKASSGGSTRDFSHWEATLYRTKRSKNFFLAGWGGPMSRYSRSIGQNETSGGEQIDPMTKEEAMTWAEQYLDADEIEAAFAEEIQDA
jgi:hypothetical protein